MERDNTYNQPNRLQELSGSDFEIADNQPNIKGWTVKDAQGHTIGEVEELVFDPNALKVRYMVVDLEGNVLDVDPRDVLVPIGLAELHESEDDVILPQITAEQLQALPTYHKDNLDRDMESSVRYVFETMGVAGLGVATAFTGTPTAQPQDDFYSHQIYAENLNRNRSLAPENDATGSTPTSLQEETTLPIIEESAEVGIQEVETGGAHISSRIVEHPVEENIRLREEHVHVERTPVNRPATPADLNTFQEGSIELTEHAEVPVVSKEARVIEEISLEKEVEVRDEVVRETVRSTEVDIDRLDTNRTDLDQDEDFTSSDRNRL